MKNSNNGKRGFGPAFPLVRSKSRWYNNIIIRCGRLKSDYRYSNTLVYNNFPWPTTTEQQKLKIEQTAQAILDARALYPDSRLADLYDELTMPPELRKAHQANDRAVMDAYGFVKERQPRPYQRERLRCRTDENVSNSYKQIRQNGLSDDVSGNPLFAIIRHCKITPRVIAAPNKGAVLPLYAVQGIAAIWAYPKFGICHRLKIYR